MYLHTRLSAQPLLWHKTIVLMLHRLLLLQQDFLQYGVLRMLPNGQLLRDLYLRMLLLRVLLYHRRYQQLFYDQLNLYLREDLQLQIFLWDLHTVYNHL